MPIVPWACAHGDAPGVIVTCRPGATALDLAPRSGGIDTNHIVVVGYGEISSLGPGRDDVAFTLRVAFEPAHFDEPAAGAPPPQIVLRHSPPHLFLLTERDRVIAGQCWGDYKWIDGSWHEVSFTAGGAQNLELVIEHQEQRLQAQLGEIEDQARRIETLEARLDRLERRLRLAVLPE